MSDDRSRERRRLAAECLALAKDTSDTDVRAFLLAMAQKWLDMAEQDEHDNWDKVIRLRAIQTEIGRALRANYGLPREVPHRILALLMQLNDGNGNGNGAS
jgi:hypothetical protein